MGSQHRRRLIAAGGIVAIGAISAIVVVLAGSASSDSSGLGPTGAYRVDREVPRWILQEHLPADALPGAKVFAIVGCTTCHTYAGTGSSALHAPDLTAIGSRHLGLAFEMRQLECPECVTPGSPRPRFASLGRRRVRQLAVFLEASKGIR
jgi:cytochrome c553